MPATTPPRTSTSRRTAGRGTISRLDRLTAELADAQARRRQADQDIAAANAAILELVQRYSLPDTKDGAEKSEFATLSAGTLRVTRPDPRTPEIDPERLIRGMVSFHGGDEKRALGVFWDVAVVKKVDVDPERWERAVRREDVTDEILMNALVEFAPPKPRVSFKAGG